MKVSACITVFNESKGSIKKLLDALNSQTLKPDEIIIVDSSNYRLPRRITPRNDTSINYELINKAGVSRAEGRNIAIKKAKNEIIAITDAGCTPHKDWLARLCSKFEIGDAGKNIVVAGGYKMVTNNDFEKAEAVFLGVNIQDMKEDFLPSARSMAFTKSIWKNAGGFPEDLNDTAEDTIFNLNLLKAGAKFVVAKNAVVDWDMPKTIKEFAKKIYRYAKGDAQSGIWWHPIKKWQTHNIKVLSIVLRYLVFIIAYFVSQSLFWLLAISYLLFAFRKAGLWGIYLQFISDFACIIGFSHGILSNCFKRN